MTVATHRGQSKVSTSGADIAPASRAAPGPRDDGNVTHDERLQPILAAVKEAARTKAPAHIDKGGVHHVVPLPQDRRFSSRSIDTSTLTNILHIDPDAHTCTAEPGVTFETLVRATLPHGLAPAVVPELRGITLGGAVAGCSVESMSFRYGGFHDSCLEYEVVGGDGTVHVLSPTESPDLFHHVHGSYGTLGILTKLTFRLVPAGKYVAMTYSHFTSAPEFEAALAEACRLDVDHDHDLVDGIVHSPNQLTLCLGRFTDDAGDTTPSSYVGEHIYYRSTQRRRSDLLTAEEYFFRYDAECHWLTATAPPLQWRWVRRRFGKWLLGSTNLISWSNRLAPILRRVNRRPDLVCDIFLPQRRFAEFWAWYCKVFDFWPLWVVPYRPASLYPWLGPHVRAGFSEGDLFIDFAVYGKRNTERHRDYSVLLEEETFDLGGIKTLIGRNHYTRERFWQIYDRPAYELARKSLDPDGLFPDLYDKLGRVE